MSSERVVWLAMGLVLLVGAALRAWILATPLGEVEADESVVGLMALHVLQGEFPVFYWGQPYLGSLESYLVAAAFALLGPSNLVLKLVPGLVYAAFVVSTFLAARRAFGSPVALLSALYLALPPSFLAVWSLKARGGYVELLALGSALLLAAPWVARARSRLWLRSGLVGLLAGLSLWTHVLGLAYVAPVALLLFVRLRSRLLFSPLLAGLAGLLLGLSPVLSHNLGQDRETLAALSTGGASAQVFQENLGRLVQVGLPVMLGFGQATSSPLLFAEDWPRRPASWPWLAPLLLVVLALALLPALRLVFTAGRGSCSERASAAVLLLGVLLLTPMLASLGRLGESVAEPRYALPLYSTVPLYALALAALARRSAALAATAVALVFALNASSLLTADPRLNLPTTAAGSTAANRAELIRHLEQRGIAEVYTDYWLAHPLMFESGERIVASVTSGGYNRYAPYAHYVSLSESPAFVFIRGSAEQAAFERRLSAAAGAAVRTPISIYDVYTEVRPLNALRG